MAAATELERDTDELRALARLTGEELGKAADGIGAVHRAVADRVFGLSGPGATPARVVHDAVAGAVYGTLRAGMGAAGSVASRALPDHGRAVSADRRGAALVAILDGLIGHELEAQGSPLAEPMAVRVDGAVVPPRRETLRTAFPGATGRVVVFAHGLFETEHSWHREGREPYGARLAREGGWTPVELRFNTGRRISQNGRSLAELLEALVAAWPVAVTELALVGHSMGGLVARSACHLAAEDGAAWVQRVTTVVSLGSPHMGAPLEQVVHAGSAALALLPESAPFARFLRRRSGGIRDLHGGSLVDQDWDGRDADALRREALSEVPLLPHARHCFVSATVTRSPRHPMGRLLGDLLVLQPSASGRSRTRRLGFKDEDGRHLGGVNHFALLHHPAVAEALCEWLAAPAASPALAAGS